MLVIGIAGGSGSGKTTVVRALTESLKEKVTVIPQDSYYKDSSHLPLEERLLQNFDHPNSIDFDLLCDQIEAIRRGETIDQPIYSFITCTRQKETVKVNPTDVIIIEGILIFSDERLRDLMDIKIFVDADADDRIMRRIKRDTIERGKSVDFIMQCYTDTVKPMYLQFVEPSKRYADVIVPQGGHNKVAIDILRATVERYVQNKE